MSGVGKKREVKEGEQREWLYLIISGVGTGGFVGKAISCLNLLPSFAIDLLSPDSSSLLTASGANLITFLDIHFSILLPSFLFQMSKKANLTGLVGHVPQGHPEARVRLFWP